MIAREIFSTHPKPTLDAETLRTCIVRGRLPRRAGGRGALSLHPGLPRLLRSLYGDGPHAKPPDRAEPGAHGKSDRRVSHRLPDVQSGVPAPRRDLRAMQAVRRRLSAVRHRLRAPRQADARRLNDVAAKAQGSTSIVSPVVLTSREVGPTSSCTASSSARGEGSATRGSLSVKTPSRRSASMSSV
jgi:hypothetical protein